MSFSSLIFVCDDETVNCAIEFWSFDTFFKKNYHFFAAYDDDVIGRLFTYFSFTHLKLLWFNLKFFMFIFMSAKCRFSKSSICECVIFSQICKSGVNLFCSTSTTWLNESIFSQVTLIVLASVWWGEHVHGDISRRTAQCKLALVVNENIVKNNVAIF